MTRKGIVAGALGALVLTAFFFLVRALTGVATPSELFADVSAPYIPVHFFGMLIALVQGYTPLKIIGFTSVLAGQFVVGLLAGIVLAHMPETRRLTAAGAIVALLWIASLTIFWPVLLTSYVGLPAGPARLATSVVLLAGYLLFAAVTVAKLQATSVRSDRSRRTFIAGGTGLAAIALVGSGIALARRTVFPYDGTTTVGPDVAAITPTSRFYIVTKNTIDPDIDRSLWRLVVGGAADKRMELSFDDLMKRSVVTQETTLMCINNPPEGNLMSNAVWRGIRLRDLLSAVGPSGEAESIALHAADNLIETIPFAKALEPTTLIAFEMNGAPLPARHGFPLRAIVPGLFGEKSVKWLTEITVEKTQLEDFYGRQGWGPSADIPTHARFDAPDFSKPLAAGPIELRGVGFCGNRGVSRVELSFDGGRSWSAAQLTTAYHALTWRLWRYTWKPPGPGTYQLAVRATDSHGNVQTSTVHGAETQGATGLHRVMAHVV